MKAIETQITFEDINEDYRAFVDKFKPKKTTDDCYTPDNIYNAAKAWVCKEYGINPDNVVRPFWPGGDYEKYPYKETDTVIDNPPFSIIGKICKFYNAYEIPFFLFAPYLTNFSTQDVCHIITTADITYENGAVVNTAFLTNLDSYIVRSVPELQEIIARENTINLKANKKELPKYAYPDEVLTAAAVGYMCSHGVEFKVKKEDAFFIRELKSQKAVGKSIFGGGFLLSERAAAERAAAERATAIKWELSDRERAIIKSLGK